MCSCFGIDKKSMTDLRFSFFFGFKNMYIIFRPKDPDVFTLDSLDFDMVSVYEHSCNSSSDFLLDLKAIYESGQISLRYNDVIGVKINGGIVCFRFAGGRFFEVSGFTDKEECCFINGLHERKQVYSVLDGRCYGLDEIDPSSTSVYAIHGEEYRMHLRSNREFITMDYYLYFYDEPDIVTVNPYNKPFFDVSAAFSYFMDKKVIKCAGGKKPLLLLNRNELYILKDWRELNSCIAV